MEKFMYTIRLTEDEVERIKIALSIAHDDGYLMSSDYEDIMCVFDHEMRIYTKMRDEFLIV